MTLSVCFTVPGQPRGKGRPRFTRQGRAYTPAQTVEYERLIGDCAATAYNRGPVDTPISMWVEVYHEIPKSWTKTKRMRALDGLEIPGKPDLDNVAKGVLDALNGLVYVDDAQVVRLVVSKSYSLHPRLVVTCTEVLE